MDTGLRVYSLIYHPPQPVGLRLTFLLRPFELGWTEITQAGVQTTRVVEALDIVEQALVRLLTSLEGAVARQLCLQGAEKALRQSVVVAVTGPAHTRLQSILIQQLSVSPR